MSRHLPVIQRFLRTYASPFGWTYVVGLVFLLATTAVTITIPKVIGRVIDLVQMPGSTVETVRPSVVWLMGLAVLLFLFRAISRVVIFYPGRKIEQSIRQGYFDQLTNLSPRRAHRFVAGDLMSRGIHDVAAVRIMVSMGVLHVVNTVVLGGGAMHGMASLSPTLTAWVALPLIGMFLTTAVAARFIYRYVRRGQESLGELSECVRETLGAYGLFATAPIHEQLLRRFERWNHEYSSVMQRVATARACFFPLMSAFVGLGVLLVLWRGGLMVIADEMALGSLVAFMTYVWILSDPAVAIGWVVNALQRGHSALVRLYAIIDADAPAAAIDRNRPATQPSEAATSLRVHELDFRYPGAVAINGGQPFELFVDRIELRAGQRLGIFGPTGSGKSTLASLLAGMLEAPPRTVEINGCDQAQVPPEVWSRWVSFVPQQTTLFSTSIADNIRMAGAISGGRLAAAVSFAALGAEVANFPRGLETQVGESGVTLSGGQRQRVSLARAFFHGGGLMILDDMTSAVDLTTEARLLAQFRTRLASQMLVMISHRVSTLRDCDEILLLEQGRVVDRGTHAQLCERNALYRATWEYEERVRMGGGGRR